MADGQRQSVRVGRILTAKERVERMADEAAYSIPGEARRSAFAISERYIVTAWHCVRDLLAPQVPLWFRLRDEGFSGRRYLYVPIRVTNYDALLDAAALVVDEPRLPEADLTHTEAAAVLASAAIFVGAGVNTHDRVQVMGFPESASGADSDTNSADVVETSLPLGSTAGLKLFCSALAAVDPVRPHGLSGGPVLLPDGAGHSHVAVGMVRAAPIGSLPAGLSSRAVSKT